MKLKWGQVEPIWVCMLFASTALILSAVSLWIADHHGMSPDELSLRQEEADINRKEADNNAALIKVVRENVEVLKRMSHDPNPTSTKAP